MTDHDTSGGHDHSDSGDAGDAALLTAMLMHAQATQEPSKAEPFVEPDYNATWSRRWRVIRPVLLVLTGIAIVALMAMASRT